MPDSRFSTRIEWRLFLAAWLAYAFFHQGGGWNQNARFAMARAVVEEGRLAVDSYLFYSAAKKTENGYRLTRTPIVDGVFRLHGADWAVTWSDDQPVEASAADLRPVALRRISVTRDLAYASGHFYLNQAPGAALLAVPGYFLLHGVERLLGLDPDDWWVFTVNGWLTTALSVGLISALGCVLFLRVALLLFGGRFPEATWATLAFAFATLFFPYATLLLEHDIVAVMLLGAFYGLLRASGTSPGGRARLPLFLAGIAAGYAAITSYIAVIPVLLLAGYLLVRVDRKDGLLWFGLGLSGPLVLIFLYNQACFGTPFTTSYHYQDPQFRQAGAFLGVLDRPQFTRLVAVLVSPFRGLFFSSPVLLAGIVGLVGMWRGGKRAEAVLCSSMAVFFVLFTISFTGWHGGWGVGPRYLIPALPFLALPLVVAFRRRFRTTLALTVLSASTMFAFTAVDVQSPVGSASIARHPGRSTMLREPLTEYALPILFTGKAWPILDAQIDDAMRLAEETLAEEQTPPEESATRLQAYRERLESSVENGGTDLPLALYSGPVSANPIGLYERWWGHVFKPGEPELDWNAFNAGELLLPRSAWSLLFLVLLWLPLALTALSVARGLDGDGRGPEGP